MYKIILLFSVLLLVGCSKTPRSYILISKDSSHRIATWLQKANKKVETREFYSIPKDSMDYFLELADGIVIGGGEDIHPSIYGKEEYTEVCGSFDRFRDSIEMVLIDYALMAKVPLLGICRGNQIINAGNGGTLIPDIPGFLNTTINHRSKLDSAHFVVVQPNSWLSRATHQDTLWVNSRHHQCIDKVAPGFKPVAIAPDGIVESIQIINEESGAFAAGVQWHPEGLRDKASHQIAKYFLKKVAADKKQ